ncbi:hypothetical protein [Pedobacter terrae]|uniref:hypothetical protein n=1 Tax=Pedobacter terrae TaxID=405671 RepID=UPI002FFAEBFD
MKKVIPLVHLLMLCIFTMATAQTRLDSIKLYQAALRHMQLAKFVKIVRPTTNRQLYHNINLSNPSLNTLDTTNTKFWHNKDWSEFLSKIDTSAIKEYTLKTDRKSWFKTFKQSGSRKIILSFSPIAFNNRNNKALFVISYQGANSGGAIVSAFFEKLNSTWVIRDVLQLALLD